MQVLDNIERIPMPPAEAFRTEYVLKQRPVILTNLFEGEPIRELVTLEAARATLGRMIIGVSEEYTSKFLKSLQPQSHTASTTEQYYYSLDEYLSFIQANPQTRKKMCLEYPIPAQLRAHFELPEYCRGDQDAAHILFVANAGDATHLHWDGDQRQVLLYQVFGRKRIILVSHKAAKKLIPYQNFSSLFVENFSEAEKRSFLNYTGGYECILHPGETLFMPGMVWHYLEYTDIAMSLSLRFGRSKYNRFLVENLPYHKDMFLQNIAAKMIDEATVEREYLPAFRELEAACRRTYRGEFEKYKHLQKLLQEIYSRICTDSIQGMYAFTNFESLDDRMVQNNIAENAR